jgi:hypothetical protein
MKCQLKRSWKHISFSAIIGLLLLSCTTHEKEILQLTDRLLTMNSSYPSESKDVDLYPLFNRYNNEAIPVLIDSITSQRRLFQGYMVTEYSTLKSYNINMAGIRAVYMIERLVSDGNEPTMTCPNRENDNLLFGLIFRRNNCDPIKDSLCMDDMIQIQKIYRDWWKENQYKSIKTLRDEWRKGKRILTNVPYGWF